MIKLTQIKTAVRYTLTAAAIFDFKLGDKHKGSDADRLVKMIQQKLDKRFKDTASNISTGALGGTLMMAFVSAPNGSRGVDYHNAKKIANMSVEGFDKDGNMVSGVLTAEMFNFQNQGDTPKKMRIIKRKPLEDVAKGILKWANSNVAELIVDEPSYDKKITDTIVKEAGKEPKIINLKIGRAKKIFLWKEGKEIRVAGLTKGMVRYYVYKDKILHNHGFQSLNGSPFDSIREWINEHRNEF